MTRFLPTWIPTDTDAETSCEMTPIEKTYEDAFKQATADGEKRRGAHIRGLEAVAAAERIRIRSAPFKEHAARCLTALARKLRSK